MGLFFILEPIIENWTNPHFRLGNLRLCVSLPICTMFCILYVTRSYGRSGWTNRKIINHLYWNLFLLHCLRALSSIFCFRVFMQRKTSGCDFCRGCVSTGADRHVEWLKTSIWDNARMILTMSIVSHNLNRDFSRFVSCIMV